MKRVEGYMTRAEQLRSLLNKDDVAKPVSAAGGTAELEKCVPLGRVSECVRARVGAD